MLTLAATLVVAAALTAPAAAYEVVTVADGGAIAGVVKFAGAPPRLAPLAVTRNHDVCGDRKESEALVLGAERGVRGSVIRLKTVARGKKPAAEVVLDHQRCVFVSHVTAAMAGETVRVKNSDPIVHSTHGFLGKPTVFNLALPGRDHTIDITRRLTRPGAIRVACDAHPHMLAWVTDERVVFRIDGIPPGRYAVTMWHEGFRPRALDRDGRPRYDEPRTVSRGVTIAPRATATIDFELK